MIDYLITHSSAISFTTVVFGFLVNLLLGIFVTLKKFRKKHLTRLSYVFFAAAGSMFFEVISYISAIMEWGVWPMRIWTVIVIGFTAFLSFIYYAYLISYYEYKQRKSLPRPYTVVAGVYVFMFVQLYITLSPSGLLFDVSPEGKYIVTDLSFIPFLAMIPLIVSCLYAIYRGRHLTNKRITTCFFIGVLIIFIGGGVDSITGISINFLWITLMDLVLYYVIMHDQDSELELAIKTEQSSRARSEFLTNMSHDIRTPMNAVLGFTDLAKKDIENIDAVKDYLDKISMSGEYLLSLINDVLDMSRIESEGVFLDESAIEISSIIDEVETIVAGRMAQKNHHFTVEKNHLPDSGVFTDSLRLKQVLINILSNAVKYTESGGEISLSVSVLEAKNAETIPYVFVIKDNGIGMEEEYLKHLFEPFSREHASTTNKQQGTGLGMAITSSIVEAMGGSISVDSKVGRGSTFTVTLPLKTCDISLAKHPEKAAISYCFSGKRILLAEDNELNRIIAIKLLEDKELSVEVAKDGREAFQMVARAKVGYYDAVLMDIQMPIMNGYESSLAIRALDSDKAQVPIIAMTANVFKEDIDKAYQSGMNGYVKKPIDLDELFSALQKVL